MCLRWWQMLPVGPTGYGDSPYQSPSTFAGNPLLISLEDLVDDGLIDHLPDGLAPEGPVDFGHVIPVKSEALAQAVTRFRTGRHDLAADFESFAHEHGPVWLDDFCLFTALKRDHDLRPWWTWEPELARRERAALKGTRAKLADAIMGVAVEQFLFDRQFRRLRDAAHEAGIGLIGDIPIFVAHDSADVWANRHLFHLRPDGRPTVVAGVPPDYFSETGQRWGNPLYDWDRHAATGFEWWTRRMRRVTDLFDLVRIDHFRGFAAAWHIPVECETAIEGSWVPSRGRELFDHLRQEFGDTLPVIAEDLGVITPDVERLRDDFGLRGMKVIQFGFGTESAHALDEFRPHVVAYTGTHDNDTARGWFESEEPDRLPEHRRALEELGSDGTDFAWDLIEAVFGSVASIAIAPLQDVLQLGSEARMNTPGVESGNWRWRFRWDQLDPAVVARMADLVRRTGRAP